MSITHLVAFPLKGMFLILIKLLKVDFVIIFQKFTIMFLDGFFFVYILYFPHIKNRFCILTIKYDMSIVERWEEKKCGRLPIWVYGTHFIRTVFTMDPLEKCCDIPLGYFAPGLRVSLAAGSQLNPCQTYY